MCAIQILSESVYANFKFKFWCGQKPVLLVVPRMREGCANCVSDEFNNFPAYKRPRVFMVFGRETNENAGSASK